MDEARLQELLEGVIEKELLLARIAGQDQVSHAFSSLRDPTFLPAFPVDYLIRQRVVQAAMKVLASIGSLTPIGDKKTSISATNPNFA